MKDSLVRKKAGRGEVCESMEPVLVSNTSAEHTRLRKGKEEERMRGDAYLISISKR